MRIIVHVAAWVSVLSFQASLIQALHAPVQPEPATKEGEPVKEAASQEFLTENVDVVTPGVYEHFKHKAHRYEVVGVARYSEDPHQEYVVYKSLYESVLQPEGKLLPNGTLWIRPKAMFLELVLDPTNKNKKVPRFKKIS